MNESETPLRGWSDRPATGGRTDFYRNGEIVASLTGPGATEIAQAITAVEAERDALRATVAELAGALRGYLEQAPLHSDNEALDRAARAALAKAGAL